MFIPSLFSFLPSIGHTGDTRTVTRRRQGLIWRYMVVQRPQQNCCQRSGLDMSRVHFPEECIKTSLCRDSYSFLVNQDQINGGGKIFKTYGKFRT